ncbi:MAG: FtsX-like permease family protein [Bacteroidia bacterium]|nr:FtsX-like permease family protein [Bacteroidia bacterium]
MLQNYFKIAFRSLWRSKVHATINILGLGLGIACCLLIVLFVRDEWTFDKFHSHARQIYRAYVKEDYGENEKFFNTVTPFPLGPVLDDNFEEIIHQVRINNIGPLVRVGNEQYTENVTIGGQDFFEVFDFDVTNGEEHNLLHSLDDLVITAATAKKYFGDDNPVGKVISMQLGENFEDFVVKAVVQDPPINSSIQFALLISDLNYPRLYNERVLTSGWFNINPETYVMLSEGTDVTALHEKFPALFKSVLGEDRFKESNYYVGLQPLTDIHLNTDFPVGNAPVSNPRYSYILAAIALLILFVACINFVTLSVGRSLRRAREVGIRKAVGAVRQQLITQFIGEALLVTCISLTLGVLLAIVSLPLFNDLSGKALSLKPDSFMLTIGLALVLIIGVFAGSYPALVLSGFRPIAVLKGK